MELLKITAYKTRITTVNIGFISKGLVEYFLSLLNVPVAYATFGSFRR